MYRSRGSLRRFPTFSGWAGALVGLCWMLAVSCRPGGDPQPIAAPVAFTDQVPRIYATYSKTQLPLLRDSTYRAAHVDLRDEARPAMLGELGGALSFNAQVPDEPELRFAMALVPVSERAPAGDVRFRVSLETRDGREVVFDEIVKPRRRGRWLPRQIDLTPWANRQALLIFETMLTSPEKIGNEDLQDLIPLWANPELAVKRRLSGQPNLILVSIDTLRADHLGAYGYERGTTPRLDGFAATATTYTDASATAPWTVPSHYSMLTGLLPSQHGVSDYFEEYWHEGRKLSASVPYLPELLSRAGYETLGVYSHFAVSTTYGFERGYAAYRRVGTDANIVVDHAIDYLRKTDERPFYLFVHLVDPHWPYMPPIEFQKYSREYIEPLGPRPGDISELLTLVEKRLPPSRESQVDDVKQLYDAAISYTDEHLGRLFDTLEELGLRDGSVVIVTSDHGEAFLEHDHWQHATTLYQEMLRVPLIVSWPAEAPNSVDEPVSIVDIFPTLLEAAGVSSPRTDAMSLAPRRPDHEPMRTRQVFAEVTLMGSTDYETTIAIRARDSKYIAVLSGGLDSLSIDNLGKEELYDMAVDPSESRNLVSEAGTDLAPWRRALAVHLDRGRKLRASQLAGDVVATDAELHRQLKALGYVN